MLWGIALCCCRMQQCHIIINGGHKSPCILKQDKALETELYDLWKLWSHVLKTSPYTWNTLPIPPPLLSFLRRERHGETWTLWRPWNAPSHFNLPRNFIREETLRVGLSQNVKFSHKDHNIIQIHNNVTWDWQYFMKYSHIQTEYREYSIQYY